MSERAPEAVVWDMMRGAMATRTIAVVSELRVADALAEGPRHVEEVAREVGADPDTLHRLLRALASDGVFAEEDSGVFGNTPASELLRGLGWADFAHLFGGVWYRTAGELGARTHAAVFPRIYGDDFWSWLAVNPTERASFDRAMLVGDERRAEQLAALEWHGDETLVDVGGGNGSLLRGLLDRVPGSAGSSSTFRRQTATRPSSTRGSPSSPVASSSGCRRATLTCSPGSCMTGTTSGQRRS